MSFRGFTLLELIIALSIFSVISIATVSQIKQIASTKEAAARSLDVYDRVRSSLSVLRQDLSQAFHILYDDLGEETKNEVLAARDVAHTLFDGRRNEIVFTSLSHRVYYENVRESEQTEISYFLHQKDRGQKASLMKRESPLIDQDLYHGGNIYTLVDNVESLHFQYWDSRVEKWVDDWNSDGVNFRDKFPPAIKVKITVLDENEKPFQVETAIKVAFTNNEYVVAQFK